MAGFEDYADRQVIKALILGDSGSGKTGGLLSLAAAGYNLRILDLDNGVEVMKDYLLNPESVYRKALPGLWEAKDVSAERLLGRVRYETLTDPMRNVAGKLIPKAATVWQRMVKLLENWKTEKDDFGSITTWTPQDVLVIDSLSFASKAAMNFILSMNARLGQQAQQSDWFAAQQLVEGMLQLLYDVNVNCNVIVLAHIKRIEEDGAPPRGLPETPGSALAPKVGTYFNHTLMVRTLGSGEQKKHRLLTRGNSLVELKTTAPMRVKPEYDIATGLAEYFQAVKKNAPQQQP